MLFKRIDGVFSYEQLDEDAQKNAYIELEDNSNYKDFIGQELLKRFDMNKSMSKDDKWKLFDLETSDELIQLYCLKNNIRFNSSGNIVKSYIEEYKSDPYGQFKQ